MRTFAIRRAAVGLVFAFAVGAPAAFAVDVNARIRGTVTDPQDAIIPGVTVVATNQATGVTFTTKTQADGSYLFPQLPIGAYTITVSTPGFEAFKATGISLNIDQEYVETIHLAVGGSTQTLEVAADPVQVNTTDMQLNNIVNSHQMQELPLIGRNFLQLEQIEPGVQAPSDRFGTGGTSAFSANGAQSQQSSYLINGADTNDLPLNTISYTPSIDAIDQFNLVTGPLNAEYDRNSGAIVNATIKQGTNFIHGSVFEFYRDTFLNTANYFQYNSSTGTKNVTPYHEHIFGGTVGAPIIKNKLFIFGSYEGRRSREPYVNNGNGSVGNTNVLSNAERGGDFSADLTGNNPNNFTFSNNVIPATLTSLAASSASCAPGSVWSACLNALGGKIPVSAFNAISAKLLSTYVPAPNSGAYGYVFNPVQTTTQDQILGRVDFSVNPRNQITVVGVYQRAPSTTTVPFTGATLPGFGEIDRTDIYQYTADYVHQFSSTLVNYLAAHYTRFNYQSVIPQTVVNPSSVGFAITPQNAAAASIPYINLTGLFALGFSTNGPQPRIDQTYQVNDSVSKTFGHHVLKFGYEGQRFNVSNPFSANNSGNYSFDPSSGAYSTGDSALDFLLGVPSSYAQGSGATIQAYAFLNYMFAQDTWKATNALTLSYGLGYQIDTPLHNLQYGGKAVTCLNPGQTSRVFPTAPKGIAYPGDPGCTNASEASTRYSDLGPRLGFAWAPDLGAISGGNLKKFSVRGGFGIYYNRTEEETSLNNLETPPFGLSSTGIGDIGGTPTFANPYADINGGLGVNGSANLPRPVINNKFPYTFPAPGAQINFELYQPLIVNQYARNFRSPYSENFQLTVEREFPARTIVRASYVGTLGRRNQITFEGNPETASGQAACLANPSCVVNRNYQSLLFPQNTAYGTADPNTGQAYFTSIGTVGSEGNSNFNALEISVQKDTTHGLQVQASYTLAHALDNGSNFENSGYGGSNGRGYNQYLPRLNYGNSSYDARNRFVFSPIYSVPFRSSGSSFSATNLALSGWQISGIMTLAQGFPFDISYGGAVSNSLTCSAFVSFYACPDVPNQTGPLVRLDPRTRVKGSNNTAWFANKNFAPEAIGTFGNEARNAYHGPGINNTNLIIAKNLSLSAEGFRSLQLRMESDNVFNHTNFALPNGNITGSFGQIRGVNSSFPARQTQIAAKFYF